ncbi:MAG TPA: hypothetical protein VIV40_35665 [Kofleriaceae bacterium]
MSADASARLTALVERIDGDPHAIDRDGREAGDKLAEEIGGQLALRWRMAVVKALMLEPPDSDSVREAYGELIDRYRDDEAALATIKPLGDEIRRRESDGSLPSTMVARSTRRKTTKQGF